MVLPEDVVAEARTWRGTNYVHQGRVKGLAVDCVGLIAMTGKALGLFEFDLTDYGRNNGSLMLETFTRIAREVDAPLPGTVAFMFLGRDGNHCGILTAENTIIHATSRVGKCVEHGYRGFLARKTVSWWALPGVTYG